VPTLKLAQPENMLILDLDGVNAGPGLSFELLQKQ
jgi:hypothetical protein